MLLTYIVFFGLIGGIGGVIIAGLFLLLPDIIRGRLTLNLLSFAIGTLLGVSFFDLLPDAVNTQDDFIIMFTVLIGIIIFFLIGKIASHQHHDEDKHLHEHSIDKRVGSIVLIGGGLHNFIDGVIIAAAFLNSVPVGIIVSISIIAHEIPHEISDLVILLECGYSKLKALLYNLLSGFASLIGSLLCYVFLSEVKAMTPFIMALAASSFIYIAISELFPKINKMSSLKKEFQNLFLILAGIGTILLLETGHHH